MRFCLCLFVLSLSFPYAIAQENHLHAEAKPAMLLPNMGHLHHPIATPSPEAQRFFDQGVTLMYAFNHNEAVRSFRRASELDPNVAMPHWGIALALGPNYNLDVDPEREKAAYDEAQKALALSANGPANERAYVEALTTRYTNDPKADLKQLGVNYSKAMAELHRHYPDDLDAATLYAESLMDLRPWGLWNADGTPTEGTEEILTVLESVLRRDPDHIGANHYYVHAEEASLHPERALPSARRLETLVPAAGHLVHMPAHIYVRTGFYPEAAKSNEQAAAVDRAYLQLTGAQGVYPMMYYSHNLHFLAFAAAQAGKFAEAKKAAADLAKNIAPHAGEMPDWMSAGFDLIRGYVLLRFHRWNEILQTPAPGPSNQLESTSWHFFRGMALACKGDVSGATAEQKAFSEGVPKTPAGAMAGFNTAQTVFQLAADSLEGQIAEARGDRKAAIAAWEKAVQVQDGLAYDEPPDWFYPVRESLGGVLLRDGQFAEAEKAFRADLARNPRNGRSLFGLWQSLKAQGNTAAAEWVHRAFETAWRDADTPLRIEDL